MPENEPLEVRIMLEQRDDGSIPTYRGWVCPKCSAVVADIDHHTRWHELGNP